MVFDFLKRAPEMQAAPVTETKALDLSRFCSGQVLMLSGSSFEGHGAFPAQC